MDGGWHVFDLKSLVVACAVVGLVCGGLGGWYFARAGRSAERVQWLEAERGRAHAAAEAARGAAAVELRRSAEAERAAVHAVSRAEEVKRETVVADRPDAEWLDAERLRLQQIHGAYFGADGAAGGVPGGLRPSAGADGGAAGVGRTGAGLGLRLPPAGQ